MRLSQTFAQPSVADRIASIRARLLVQWASGRVSLVRDTPHRLTVAVATYHDRLTVEGYAAERNLDADVTRLPGRDCWQVAIRPRAAK